MSDMISLKAIGEYYKKRMARLEKLGVTIPNDLERIGVLLYKISGQEGRIIKSCKGLNSFLSVLADLMDEHCIQSITASDEWQGHPETGEDIQICIQESTEYIDLGKCIDSDLLRDVVRKRM